MWCIGGLLIYLAIAKKMEPALLLPMGFGAILMNLPIAEEGTGVQAVIESESTLTSCFPCCCLSESAQ